MGAPARDGRIPSSTPRPEAAARDRAPRDGKRRGGPLLRGPPTRRLLPTCIPPRRDRPVLCVKGDSEAKGAVTEACGWSHWGDPLSRIASAYFVGPERIRAQSGRSMSRPRQLRGLEGKGVNRQRLLATACGRPGVARLATHGRAGVLCPLSRWPRVRRTSPVWPRSAHFGNFTTRQTFPHLVPQNAGRLREDITHAPNERTHGHEPPINSAGATGTRRTNGHS